VVGSEVNGRRVGVDECAISIIDDQPVVGTVRHLADPRGPCRHERSTVLTDDDEVDLARSGSLDSDPHHLIVSRRPSVLIGGARSVS
jgi:hypothetical protein